MGVRISTTLDVKRVWELYQVKGNSAKTIAHTLGTTPEDVRAALAVNAREQRATALQAAKALRVLNDERAMFNNAMPHIKDDEGDAWKAWLARSRLKV